MKTLSFKVSDEVKAKFTADYQASGTTNQSEFFASLVMGSTPSPVASEKNPDTDGLKKFQFLAIIDGTVSRPVLPAKDEKDARKTFDKKWPNCTIHECKEVV